MQDTITNDHIVRSGRHELADIRDNDIYLNAGLVGEALDLARGDRAYLDGIDLVTETGEADRV